MDVPEQDRQQYEMYVQKLREAEDALERAKHRAAGFRKIVEGFTEAYPQLGADAPGADAAAPASADLPPAKRRVVRRSPTGKRAVGLLLQETEETLTVGEIMERLKERGTAPATEEALRTTLNRMFKNDETVDKSEKDGRLAYRWKR